MTYDPEEHHRRSIRLKGYDYSQAGAYFVTVCTHDRACVFGDVVDGEMRLNEYGAIVKDEWLRTDTLRGNVVIDEYIIMPNHIHGIVIIMGNGRGMARRAPTLESFSRPVAGSLSTIMRSFKSAATKEINKMSGAPNLPVWQRNYY